MSNLQLYQEFQAIHDNLRVIDRDLSAFPPELAALQAERSQVQERLASLTRALPGVQTQQTALTNGFVFAEKQEAAVRASVKACTSKTQYSAALRDLGERERQKTAAQKPLKEIGTRLASMEEEIQELGLRLTDLNERFEIQHADFLLGHENQVVAKKVLLARRLELESALGTGEVTRLNRLFEARNGRAVVSVEQNTCSGCRTKLRGPFLARFKEDAMLPCESCQRLLFVPSRHVAP